MANALGIFTFRDVLTTFLRSLLRRSLPGPGPLRLLAAAAWLSL